MQRACISLIMMAILVSPVAPACAQDAVGPKPVAPPASNSFDPSAAMAEVRQLISERYVLPERRAALDAVLAEGLRSGRYKTSQPGQFAERVSADLARVGKDKHLYFDYLPERYATMTARTSDNRPDPSAREQQVRRLNHGIQELRILPGNVRYLDLGSWQWLGDETTSALDTAMAFLKGGDAVIIDVRRNGGGHGDAVRHVISHFMDAGRPLVTFYRGGDATPTTLSSNVTNKMIGKPLYVLVSGGTASASEEFAGNVAGYRLGETVGENTAGAAYMNGLYPVSGGFILSVSVARSVLGSTGMDWEAKGIAPTVPVVPEDALSAANILALKKNAASASPDARKGLEALVFGLEAISKPRTPASPLATYTGSYGDRRVFLEGNTLWYRQAERMKRRLIPLGGDRFTLMDDPSLLLVFQKRGSRVMSFDYGPATGPIQARYERAR